MTRIRRLTPCMTAIVCGGVLIACRVFGVYSALGLNPFDGERQVTVDRVIDGDTFKTITGERVRLLGIDAPEVAHHGEPGEDFGDESAAWLRQQIEHQTVTLRFGPEPTDQYDRTLAWVYSTDGTHINARSLRSGHAVLLDRFGLSPDVEPELRSAAAEARLRRSGLWQRRKGKRRTTE